MGRKAARPPPSEESDDYEDPPPRKGKKAAPPSEYSEEEEEEERPSKSKGKGGKGKRPPTPEEEEEEEEEEDEEGEDEDDDEEEEKLSFPEKYDRFIESLSPGMKMIYTMITAAITLMIITVVGGLVYFALERKLALQLNANYMAFMAQLEDTLNCVSNSTDPVPAGNCTDANGPAMYQSLIDNYMQDPNTLVDVWGPLTNTLYLFAFTIVSTIGYGTFAPKTAGGQIFTIFYALFSIPVGGVLLGKLAGTLLELGEWACYTMFSGRIRTAYKEANKNGDGILDYDDMRLAIMKAQGHEIDPGDFNSAVKENDKFETHDISHSNFVHIYLKVDKEEMQEARAADRAKVCALMVLGWLLLGMRYFGQTEGWTMVEAFYFGIVTLTTIGFGDYVPTTPAGDAFHFLFCIFGLGLVATLLGAISALAADSGGGDAEDEEGGDGDNGGKAKKGGDEDEEDTRKPGRASSMRRKAPHPKSGLAGVAMMQEGASRHRMHGGGGGGGKGKRAPSVISEEEEEDEPAPATPSTPTGLFGLPMVDFGAAMPWLNGGGQPAPPAPTAKAGRKPVREDSVTSSIAPPPKAKRSAKREEQESPKAGKGKGKGGRGKRMDADL